MSCENGPILLVKTEDQAQGVGGTRDLLLCMPPQQKGGVSGKVLTVTWPVSQQRL